MTPMTSFLSHPLLCDPLFKPKIWGGRRLETILGKQLPPGEPIGESWEVADIAEGASTIANGRLAGMSLREAMAEHGHALAPGAGDGRFPLLVKFIDAEDDISVQLHPDAEACRRHFPHEHSKHECWIVVDAAPGACILHGVRPEITRSEVESRIRDESFVKCLRRVPVQAGDVIDVPPGTLHAACKGVVLLEVQEPSDSTFRVYDYGRTGEDGRPRALHIEEALRALRLRRDAPAKLDPKRDTLDWGEYELLVDAAPFRVERLTLRRSVPWPTPSAAPAVLVVLAGGAAIPHDGESIGLCLGETCILPAALEGVDLQPDGDAVVVLATPRADSDES